MENVNTYSKKERNMFLTGMFGQNMIYNVVTVGLYYYFQNVICLPAIAFGWIFAIARIWDAINDPMMGSIVDKTRTKWGKCRPYLIFSPIVICVITIAAFFNGNYANAKANGNKTAMIFIVALGGDILCAVGNELYGRRYSSMGHYFTYNGKRKGQKLAYFSFKNYCVNRCRLGCDFNCCSVAIAKLRFWLRHKCSKRDLSLRQL